MPQTKFEVQEKFCMDSNNKSGEKKLFACCAVVDQFLEKDSITELEIEIDSFPDGDFGDLYRVWKNDRLLGTFYESFTSDNWKAQPVDSIKLISCDSAELAQIKIIESYLNNKLV